MSESLRERPGSEGQVMLHLTIGLHQAQIQWGGEVRTSLWRQEGGEAGVGKVELRQLNSKPVTCTTTVALEESVARTEHRTHWAEDNHRGASKAAIAKCQPRLAMGQFLYCLPNKGGFAGTIS